MYKKYTIMAIFSGIINPNKCSILFLSRTIYLGWENVNAFFLIFGRKLGIIRKWIPIMNGIAPGRESYPQVIPNFVG